MIEINSNRDALVSALGENKIANMEGRVRQIQTVLEAKHILVLGGGALEHHLPSYAGDRYSMSDEAKKAAVAAEVELLGDGSVDCELAERYGELFRCIAELPAKPPVDIESVLLGYVSDYIHELQGLVVSKPDWEKSQIEAHFGRSPNGLGRLITIVEYERSQTGEFRAELKVAGPQTRFVDVSHTTNAGMRQFAFRVGNSDK